MKDSQTILTLGNPLTDAYKSLKDIVNSPTFPWYWHEESVVDPLDGDNFPFYGHTILTRPGHDGMLCSTSDSPFLPLANQVLKEIFEYNNVDVDMVYRINVNCTHKVGMAPSPPHCDHAFDHTNLVMYLSHFDLGETIVYDEDGDRHIHTPNEDDIVLFKGIHNIEQPALGCRRIVLVATFS